MDETISPYTNLYRAHLQGGYAVCCSLAPVTLPELHHEELEINLHYHNTLAEKTWHSATGRQVRRVLSPEQISLTCAGQPHSVLWKQPAETVLIFLRPDAFMSTTHEDGRGAGETTEQYGTIDPLLYHLGQAIHTDLRQGNPHGSVYLDSVFTVLTVHVMRNYSLSPPTIFTPVAKLPLRSLQNAFEYIEAHLGEDVRLGEIAAVAGYSPYHFSRMFKNAVGFSVYKYVIRRRIEAAKRLLSQPELSLGQIAYQVGFGSQSHFNRHFRESVGVTPSEFRRR